MSKLKTVSSFIQLIMIGAGYLFLAPLAVFFMTSSIFIVGSVILTKIEMRVMEFLL